MKIRHVQKRYKQVPDNKEPLLVHNTPSAPSNPPSPPPLQQPTASTAPETRLLENTMMLVFRHNPLHDMESVVWLAFYLTVFCEVAYPDDVTPMTVK